MRLLRFLISRTFWLQVALALAMAVVGYVVMNVALRAFTRHSERIAVPAVVGLDGDAAALVLEDQGLTPVVMDSLYNANGTPGAVVEQDPAMGVEVKGRRNVYLTVYRSTPPSERLGVEEGMDAGVARILLDVKGFKFRERYAPTPELAGLVLRVEDLRGDSLGPDDRLSKGEELVLVIGERVERQVALPDFVGMPWVEVESRLLEVELALGRCRWSSPPMNTDDSLSAVISSQFPEPVRGRRVNVGSEVDFYIEFPLSQELGGESLFE